MRYSKKMFLLFAAMGIIIAAVSFGFYYNYKVQVYEREEYDILTKQAEQITHRLDTAVEQMEFAVSFLLSDIDVLNGMHTLSGASDLPNKNYESAEAIRSIRISLGAWYLTRNFNSVVVFNENGTAINEAGKLNEESAAKIIAEQDYASLVEGQRSGRTLRGVHPSVWNNPDGDNTVISLVQDVKGYNNTFIEAEYDYTQLGLPEDENFLICDEQGNELINHRTGNSPKELTSSYSSQTSGITVSVTADKQEIQKKIRESTFPDILLIFIFILAILVFVQITSHYLTGPIMELSSLLEERDVSNLCDPFLFHSNIKEVDSLGNSFRRLLARLNDSMELEKKAVKLQMQAQFDALQAGVDPHFIFNVLNIIANRGMMAQDDMICRICSKLAAILQYSTNTRIRNATVAEELQYLQNYFFLIQERFQERFSYEFDIDPDILTKDIPKLGLQQLAENCIKHGFTGETLKIMVIGQKLEDGWYMAVQDDGEGFSPSSLQELRDKIRKAKEELHSSQPGYEIGGMGIVNTYLRFYLLYGEHMDFLIDNTDTGALITVKIFREEADV